VEMSPREQDRRKLRWLIVAFVGYFFFVVYALPHASTLPYQIFALCAVLNLAIIGVFVFSIRKVCLRMKGLTLPTGVEVDETTVKLRLDFDRRRLKWLWLGAVLFSLALLNGLRLCFVYAGTKILLIVILSVILNGLILTAFIVSIREVYERLESGKSP
jgi:hypothetical protein